MALDKLKLYIHTFLYAYNYIFKEKISFCHIFRVQNKDLMKRM